jgi:hypothetical protein
VIGLGSVGAAGDSRWRLLRRRKSGSEKNRGQERLPVLTDPNIAASFPCASASPY